MHGFDGLSPGAIDSVLRNSSRGTADSSIQAYLSFLKPETAATLLWGVQQTSFPLYAKGIVTWIKIKYRHY